jgi:osmotically-inducible protein OsmY
MSLKRTAVAAGVGAAAAYLLDPDRGRSRRARLRDQGEAFKRRQARALERQASFQRGRAEGLVQRARHRGGHPPADDRALADRVRTEVLRHDPAHTHLNVDAVGGVVSVRGEVADLETAMDVERRIRAIPGVVEVENLLHAPGEPAPNKADALRVQPGR